MSGVSLPACLYFGLFLLSLLKTNCAHVVELPLGGELTVTELNGAETIDRTQSFLHLVPIV